MLRELTVFPRTPWEPKGKEGKVKGGRGGCSDLTHPKNLALHPLCMDEINKRFGTLRKVILNIPQALTPRCVAELLMS